ncbi:hypothetical protein JTE90_024660 [Oedothorax gibbosus]|uniref:Large subunit GTPase 1 homolog n=1 Tax=Oedothorax gibbosus TaxID=931172 RepID=A0AAV6U4A7_9ARAC|nr:hypothetical protein JTE90_024660 [Oedothorax gibbosus]
MPKNSADVGKMLIKAHKKKGRYIKYEGFRHASDLPDGRDCARLDLKSVTEQTSLDDFLDKAALAENDFNAELANIKIVDPKKFTGILSEEERVLVSEAQDKNQDILCIPRRPHWDISQMSKEEIDANEREAFLVWRRRLAELQETAEHINLTPFEKNLEDGDIAPEMSVKDEVKIRNSPEVLSREDVIKFFKLKSQDRKKDDHVPTIGLVGYPNVGKSSTLNALLMVKKACVSATPGKTKHFQTHIIDEDLCLCDCPGLVFPNFISTKAEMVINGILPIDQLTESIQPVTLISF